MRRRDLVIGSLIAGFIGHAWAQRAARVDRIAVVHASSPIADISETGGNPLYRVFFEELRRLGHVEGANLEIERYSGEGRTEHHAELVGEVVRRRPDVICANTSTLVRQFKDATSTIPIVGLTADPVAYGIVERHHGADNEHAAGALVEMRPRADFAPGVMAGII